MCVIIIIYENTVKSKYGQFLYKDQTLLFSTFSYWFFLQNYVFLVVIVFCFHCLIPLEIELFELVEIYNTMFVWCFYSLLTGVVGIFVVTSAVISLNSFTNWANERFILILVFVIFLVLLISVVFMLYDFMFSSLTSSLFWNNCKQYFIQSKSSMTYDNILFVTDQFDWHKDQTNFFVFRFEDLYQFFLKLLSLSTLVFATCVWFFILNDISVAYSSNSKLSYTIVAVGLRWLDNCMYIFFINYIVLFLAGLRVLSKIVVELWDYSF